MKKNRVMRVNALLLSIVSVVSFVLFNGHSVRAGSVLDVPYFQQLGDTLSGVQVWEASSSVEISAQQEQTKTFTQENYSSQWAKTFGGSGEDNTLSIQRTSDGGSIVLGSTGSFGSNNGLWIIKLDSSGKVEWQKTYGGSDFSIHQTPDDGYILAGGIDNDFQVLKLNPTGNVEWQKTYGGPYSDVAESICQTKDGGYIVAGFTRFVGAGNDDIWILKLDSSGNVEWQKTYGGNDYDGSPDIQETSDGSYIVGGYTNSFGAGIGDIWILKLRSDGKILWQKTFGGSKDDQANALQQTSDGGYIVAGMTCSFGAGSNDIWVLKLNANGDIPGCPLEGNSSATVINTTITGVDTNITG